MKRHFCHSHVCCHNVKSLDDLVVKQGLAYTPSQMAALADRGVPISTQSIGGSFYDGDLKCSWDVPIERQRGVDPADVWQAQQTSRYRLRSQKFNVDNQNQ